MIDLIILTLSLTLISLQIYFGEIGFPSIFKVFFTFPIWIIIIKNISINRVPAFYRDNKLLFFFFLLVVIAYLRSFFSGVATINELCMNLFIILTIFLFAFSFVQNKKIDKEKLLLFFFGSIGVYNLLNIGMYLIGFHSSTKRIYDLYSFSLGKAVMLESLGINTDRILLPLANGLNNYGVICGVSLVFYSIILLKKGYKRKIKIVSLIFIASSLVGILMTDSRGALLFAIISIFLSFVIPDKKKNLIPRLLFVIPLLIPILFYSIDFISDTLNYFNINILDNFTRGSSDIQQFAGRAIIWQSALDKLSSFSFNHIIGYGWFGQTISGAIYDYFTLAITFGNAERVTLHNSYIQYVFNIGYIGLLVFLTLYYRLFQELLSENFKPYPALSSASIAALLFMTFAALFETNLALIGDENTYFLVFIFIILSKYKSSSNNTSTNSIKEA